MNQIAEKGHQMTTKEMLQLDEWIAKNVTGIAPRMEAAAWSKDEKGIAMWEGDLITRKAIREFCEKFPQYHYKETAVYPRPTIDSAAAMEVLKRCLEKLGSLTTSMASIGGHYSIFVPAKSSSPLATAETLELAICKFAQKLFSK